MRGGLQNLKYDAISGDLQKTIYKCTAKLVNLIIVLHKKRGDLSFSGSEKKSKSVESIRQKWHSSDENNFFVKILKYTSGLYPF